MVGRSSSQREVRVADSVAGRAGSWSDTGRGRTYMGWRRRGHPVARSRGRTRWDGRWPRRPPEGRWCHASRRTTSGSRTCGTGSRCGTRRGPPASTPWSCSPTRSPPTPTRPTTVSMRPSPTQSGIDDVFAEDREVVHLRTALALERRARGRRPRDRRGEPLAPASRDPTGRGHRRAGARPRRRRGAGAGRAPASSGRPGDARDRSYFHRVGEDGFVQAVSLARGLGRLSDGTDLTKTVTVHCRGAGARDGPQPADVGPPALRRRPLHDDEQRERRAGAGGGAGGRHRRGAAVAGRDALPGRARAVGERRPRADLPAGPAPAPCAAVRGVGASRRPPARCWSHLRRSYRALGRHPDAQEARRLLG